jgi:hypothetical protein
MIQPWAKDGALAGLPRQPIGDKIDDLGPRFAMAGFGVAVIGAILAASL